MLQERFGGEKPSLSFTLTKISLSLWLACLFILWMKKFVFFYAFSWARVLVWFCAVKTGEESISQHSIGRHHLESGVVSLAATRTMCAVRLGCNLCFSSSPQIKKNCCVLVTFTSLWSPLRRRFACVVLLCFTPFSVFFICSVYSHDDDALSD